MIFNSVSNAKELALDNGKNNLKSKNVQGAIDELAGRIIFSDTEPLDVEENTIVMVYEV